MAENTDEFIARIQHDELADATKLTPRDYASRIGISPQLVYYHLRNHGDKLQTEMCVCGRKVLDIKQADEYFDFNQPSNLPLEEDK